MEKITNEEVLRSMGTSREIVRQFKKRKLQYLGHLMANSYLSFTGGIAPMHMLVSMYYCIYMFSYGPYGPEIKHYYYYYYYKTYHITTNGKKDRKHKIQWPTKNYLANGPDKQHWSQVLPTKDSSRRSKKMAWSRTLHICSEVKHCHT